MRWLLFVAVVGCGEPADLQPDAADLDASALTCRADVRIVHEFGDPCTQNNDGSGFTECQTETCDLGVCAIDHPNGGAHCRSFCKQAVPPCPRGERAIPIYGRTSDDCMCLPTYKWDVGSGPRSDDLPKIPK